MAVKTVLITGGTGLIGSNLAGQLAARGYKVIVLGRSARLSVPEALKPEDAERVEVVAGDPSDPELLAELLAQSDAVFHKAASVGMAGAVESAHDYVGANMITTASLIDLLRAGNTTVKKVILGSSVSVYGEGNYKCTRCGTVRPELRSPTHPVSHPVRWNPPCPSCAGEIEPIPTPETADRNGESIYAVTKKAQEDLLAGTCRQLDIPLTILRYATVLGAGQSWHNPFTRVLELLGSGEPPVIHEDGMQTRDFVFVEDVVEANIQALLKQDVLIEKLNVSGVQMPLLHFVNELSQAMGAALSKKPIEAAVDGKLIPGDVRHCFVDCTRLERIYGFKPQHDLSSAVERLVQWFVRFKGLVPTRG